MSGFIASRFWFGPVAQAAADALWQSALLQAGGRPFRVIDGQIALPLDAACSRWQSLPRWQPEQPVVGLWPLERRWPGELLQAAVPTAMLLRQPPVVTSPGPALETVLLADWPVCWLPETSQDQARLAAQALKGQLAAPLGLWPSIDRTPVPDWELLLICAESRAFHSAEVQALNSLCQQPRVLFASPDEPLRLAPVLARSRRVWLAADLPLGLFALARQLGCEIWAEALPDQASETWPELSAVSRVCDLPALPAQLAQAGRPEEAISRLQLAGFKSAEARAAAVDRLHAFLATAADWPRWDPAWPAGTAYCQAWQEPAAKDQADVGWPPALAAHARRLRGPLAATEAADIARELALRWPLALRLRQLAARQIARSAPAGDSKASDEPVLDAWLACHLQQAGLQGNLPAPPGALVWEGSFAADESLGRVNRALSQQLSQTGRWPMVYRANPPLPADSLPLSPTAPPLARVLWFSHQYPPRLQAPAADWISILPWEYGALPRDWLALRHSAAWIWAPSRAVLKGFEAAGFAFDSLQLLPNGVDTAVFQPDGQKRPLPAKRRMLFVGGCIARKGIDLLLQAWQQAFTAADPVCLVIKDAGLQGPYALAPERQQLQELAADPTLAEIVYLDQNLSESELAVLYRSCDLYVHPYRGEGFGLPILEAMASGLPVLVPELGPAPEFVPEAAAYWLKAHYVFDAELARALDLHLPAWWLAPDPEHLSTLLRQALADMSVASAWQARRTAARQAAEAYDWSVVAQQAERALQQLLQWPCQQVSDLCLHSAAALPAADLPPGWRVCPGETLDPADLPEGLLHRPDQLTPATGTGDLPVLYWLYDWQHLPLRPDPAASWLVADRALAEALQQRGVAPQQIGFLGLAPQGRLPQTPAAAAGAVPAAQRASSPDTCLTAWITPAQCALLADLRPVPRQLCLLSPEAGLAALVASLEPVLALPAWAQTEPELLILDDPAAPPDKTLLAHSTALWLGAEAIPLSWWLAAFELGLPVWACGNMIWPGHPGVSVCIRAR
ncbi:MAG: glycosyltransferase [Candidatus Sericytochromatia bacterium]|nr:glycosyltransferase [Candidatus Sericytochromatia bacterium]